MKQILLIFLLSTVIGCSQSDEGIEPLDGYYSLNSVSCECSPIEIVEHQQQWLFDFDNLEVNVKTFGEIDSHLILESGVYSFELLKNEIIMSYDSTDLIRVGGREFGFIQSEGIINLSSGAPLGIADLPAYIFIKNR